MRFFPIFSFGLFLFSLAAPIAGFVSVCERTPQIRDAIITAIFQVPILSATTAVYSPKTGDLSWYIDCMKLQAEHLKFIKRLYIKGNIEELRPGDFGGLVNLEELDLNSRGLKKIPRGIHFPDSITTLNLSYNYGLQANYEEILKQMPNLEVLKINHLEMPQLPSFRENPKLRILEAKYNRGTSNKVGFVLKNHFQWNKNLQYIDLSGIYMVKVPDGLFDGLEQLKALKLAHCRIETWDDTTLKDNVNLQVFDIQHNRLRKFPRVKSHKLQEIYVDGNPISSIPPGHLKHSGHQLRILSASNTRITEFPSRLFFFMPNLEKLLLDHTFIEALPKSDPPPSSLKYISLEGTPVIVPRRGWPTKDFASGTSFSPYSSDQKFIKIGASNMSVCRRIIDAIF